MLNSVLKLFSNLFGLNTANKAKKKENWVKMMIDKVFFEAQTNRYFLILRSANSDPSQSLSLNLGSYYDENFMRNYFGLSNGNKSIISHFGIKIEKIRISKKDNITDFAECYFKAGFFTKKVRMNNLDAIRLAFENNMNIEVSNELIKADKFDLMGYKNLIDKMDNNVFSTKYVEKDDFNNEVIM